MQIWGILAKSEIHPLWPVLCNPNIWSPCLAVPTFLQDMRSMKRLPQAISPNWQSDVDFRETLGWTHAYWHFSSIQCVVASTRSRDVISRERPSWPEAASQWGRTQCLPLQTKPYRRPVRVPRRSLRRFRGEWALCVIYCAKLRHLVPEIPSNFHGIRCICRVRLPASAMPAPLLESWDSELVLQALVCQLLLFDKLIAETFHCM